MLPVAKNYNRRAKSLAALTLNRLEHYGRFLHCLRFLVALLAVGVFQILVQVGALLELALFLGSERAPVSLLFRDVGRVTVGYVAVCWLLASSNRGCDALLNIFAWNSQIVATLVRHSLVLRHLALCLLSFALVVAFASLVAICIIFAINFFNLLELEVLLTYSLV